MRLLLWYGTLLAVALSLFAVLILLLTMNAINQNVDSDVRAETRVASLNVRAELSSQPPYWPSQLSLDAINGTLLTRVRKSCKGRAVLPKPAHQVTAEAQEE